MVSRLGRLMTALTARERALLVLRARRRGEDTALMSSSVPDHQRHEYNSYMGLLFVSACQLNVLVHVLDYQLDGLQFDIERMALLDRAATMLEEDYPEDIASQPVRPWRQRSRKNDRVTVPEFLRSLSAEVQENAAKELTVRWKEVRSVELVAQDIAARFEGVDTLPAELREQLEACRKKGEECGAKLGRKRLPEPEDDYLERVHDMISQAFETLGLVKL